MLNDENGLRQPISIDLAPTERVCEWCWKPAVYQLTALGGMDHNESGFFCGPCSEAFVRAVASSLYREVREEVTVTL